MNCTTNKNSEIIPEIFDSKIKKIRIELPDYHFSHSLSDKSHFVGRKKILEKLKSLIKDSENKTGVYLVTGNRGVGKTSFVDKVIKATERTNKRLLHLHINFGHNLNEKDVLRLIARTLGTKYNKYCRSWRMLPWNIIKSIAFFVFCFSAIYVGKQLFNIELLSNIINLFAKISLIKNIIEPIRSWQPFFLSFFITIFS